eukprot:8022055-Lingulodinium_polyedra.AAC.1
MALRSLLEHAMPSKLRRTLSDRLRRTSSNLQNRWLRNYRAGGQTLLVHAGTPAPNRALPRRDC